MSVELRSRNAGRRLLPWILAGDLKRTSFWNTGGRSSTAIHGSNCSCSGRRGFIVRRPFAEYYAAETKECGDLGKTDAAE
ncbi:hypothetical protein FH972_025950 [Carpinus fangiana]|uniref:Uncharacterized protein n=1 Tax=Carpinus fangiana TaxID=176857 RepID=A0A5N6L551_9ROSI|nr:hypothetical protein FH972_025950 [Carpinus fangiana]